MLIMKEEELKQQQKWRLKTNNQSTKKYERTINGLLMRRYRNMINRVNGVDGCKKHLYMGKELLTRDEFYNWSKSNRDFLSLYDNWKDSNFERRIGPSLDRIDSSKGYIIGNIRWITFSENCSLGALAQKGIKKDDLPLRVYNRMQIV